MKHHRKPKKQQPSAQELVHTMVFTIESLTVLQKAFQVMEEVFQRNLHRDYPHLPFAQETFAQVKQKVATMLSSPEETITFDVNEKLIIRACIQVYTIDLLCMQATPERDYQLTMCYQLAGVLQLGLSPPIQLHD